MLGCDRCLVAACCPQGAVTNPVADVAELPPLPRAPGLPLACSSRWFVDSALLKGELLWRGQRCYGAQLLPRELCPSAHRGQSGVTGASAFNAASLGWTVSLPRQGSSSVKCCNKSEWGGWEECLVLRQGLSLVIIAGGAFMKGTLPTCPPNLGAQTCCCPES